MDCRLIQGELLAYALGTSDDGERERIDAHLLTCTACLRAYLRLKHHVERGASLGARPGDDVRRRIRDDVAAAVRPRGAARVQKWLRRPIPLYQGLAVAAFAAGVAVAGRWAIRDAMSRLVRPPTVDGAGVDASRPVAARGAHLQRRRTRRRPERGPFTSRGAVAVMRVRNRQSPNGCRPIAGAFAGVACSQSASHAPRIARDAGVAGVLAGQRGRERRRRAVVDPLAAWRARGGAELGGGRASRTSRAEKFTDPEKAFAAAKEALLTRYYAAGLTEGDLYRAAVQGMLTDVDPKMHKWNKLLSPERASPSWTSDLKGELVAHRRARSSSSEATGHIEVAGDDPGLAPRRRRGSVPRWISS